MPIVLGGELRDEKNTNKEGNGGSDFDGSCCIVKRNNQPKVGRIDGVYLGEATRRAVAIVGDDAVTPFRPSD